MVIEYNCVLVWGKVVGFIDVFEGLILGIVLGVEGIEFVVIFVCI